MAAEMSSSRISPRITLLPDVADPTGFIAVAVSGDGAWFGWPTVPAIEEVRAKLALAGDPKTTKRIEQKIQKHVVDNVVMIPMGQFDVITSKSKRLSGRLDAEIPVFWNITKAKK
jgi:peptide/nickel transport system substrate-binding protein